MTDQPIDEKAVFNRARQIVATEERLAYLQAACGQDQPALRRIQELLLVYDQEKSFLESPAVELASPPWGAATEVRGGRTVDEPVSEKPGAVIGPYKLLQQIGEGGMGVVWMAEQTQPVQRKVALKIIKPGMDSRQVIARFEAERQALALMDHVNIARVFDGGATENGRPYFVMELVHGVPITKYCDDNHLTPRERLELFVPVCQAIQHAHQKGIIHRDIKPSNVMVTLYDGKPVPKVIDFGVAKATEQKLTERTLFTQYGTMVGTLEYMSPEQAEMSALGVDTRSDIYSLGVLLYELLTGSTPLDRKRMKEAAFGEILRMIKEEEPPKPSTRLSTTEELPSIAVNRGVEPKKLSGLMRGELDWIVMKTLEKDRNRRYETANGFAQDVQRYLADEPVQACPPSVGYRMRKFARRNKLVLGTMALLSVMMIIVAVTVAENFRREAKAQEEAHDRLVQNQKDEARKREELAGRLATTESAVNLFLARSDSFAEQAVRLPTATSKEAAAALAVRQQAEAELARAEAALDTGTAESAVRDRVASARRRLDLARGQTEQHHARALREEKLRRDLDEANTARPSMASDRVGAAAASEMFEKAFSDYGLELKPDQTAALAKRIRAEKTELRNAIIAGIDNWTFVAAGNRTMTPLELRSIARAADDDPWRADYRDAISKRDATALKSLATKARDLTLPAVNVDLLASSLAKLDQHAEAVSLLRWARDKHPKDIWIPFNLAILLESDPRRSPAVVEEQIGCYRLFLAMRPDSPAVLNNLGTCLARRGKVDESITSFRAALKLKADYAMAHGNLANSLTKMRLLDEALSAYDTAIRLQPDHASFHTNRGATLLEKGLVDQAAAAQEKAVKLNPESAVAYSNLGNALRHKAMLKEALAACENAIRLDPTLAAAHDNLGIILGEQRKFDAAIASHEKAVHLDPDNAATHCNLALALADKKRFPEAETTCRLAIKLQPNLAAAHNALGVVLYLQEKNADAVTSFREALRHKPDYVNAHYNLGLIYLKQKQATEAMTAMELTIKYDARHAEAHLQIGRILVDRQQYAESVKFFKQAIVLKENLAEAHMLLGLSRWELNDLDAAAKSFKEGLRLDPNSAMTHFYLGRLHERQKQPEAAIASYNEAIRLQPDHAPGHYNLGTLLADKNQLDAAANALRQAIKWDKDHAKAHNNLGIVLARQGKVADAIPCFREALRCDAKYPLARAMLAQALNFEAWPLVAKTEASRANAERAVKMASEAVELNPKLADYWNTLGVGNYRADNWDKSIAALNKSASMSKENDWCDFLFLAMAHWKKGDKAEARTWYDRAAKRIRDQRIDTEESRRFQSEAAALLGLPKEPK
jgi:eukaryotic-like serine/threonine-protein kinase